jgi:hypothetical protein
MNPKGHGAQIEFAHHKITDQHHFDENFQPEILSALENGPSEAFDF